jgi:hypothetical protein
MKCQLLVISCLLSGCTSFVWVGRDPNRDMYECKIEAARVHQPALYTQQIAAGTTSPSYTNCTNIGNLTNCTTTGGNYTPPIAITSDANSGVRNDYVHNCMTQRGNRVMSESEAKTYNRYDTSGETPTQRRIRIREECRQNYGTDSPLCRDTDTGTTSPDETPTQRRIRLREECRRIYGERSSLC